MNTSRINIVAVILVFAGTVPAADQSAFFDDRTATIMTEYLECTRDSMPMSTDSMIAWKNRLNNFVNSPAFPSIYRNFVAKTGMRENVSPCYVMMWAENNEFLIKGDENLNADAMMIRGVLFNDSAFVAKDLKENKSTAFDFTRIPLGVSQRTFKILFAESYQKTLEPDGTALVCRNLAWAGEAVAGVFRFDKEGRFARYELETTDYSADSLDGAVRPVAMRMARIFGERAGEPDRIYRVGFYDIVQDRISPYRSWRQGKYSAIIGLGTRKYRYFVRVIIQRD